MQNQRPGARGWGLAPATRRLLDTADPAEPGRRDPQVERAIQSFLAQPAGSANELNDALSDQLLILAHHFGVEESYFLDPDVAEKVAAQRKRRDWSVPTAHSAPTGRPRHAAPDTASTDGASGPSTDGEDAGQGKSKVLVGVAAAAVAVLAAGAVGGAVGYKMGVGAGKESVLAAGPGVAGAPAPALGQGVAGDPMRDVAKRAQAGVVQIRAHGAAPAATVPGAAPGAPLSTGAGIVLSSDGLMLTNDHIVAAAWPAGEVTVQFANGASRPAHIIGRDPAADLAVVAADNVNGLIPIKLGNSDSVRVGEQVVAIGSPFGPGGTDSSSVTSTVSAINHPVALGHDAATKAPHMLNAIQTDAGVSAADSGGPLLDARGFVIGLGTAVPAGAEAPGRASVPGNPAAVGNPTAVGNPAAGANPAAGGNAVAPGSIAVPGDAAPAATGSRANGPAENGPAAAAKFGYAIPINLAERIAEHLIATGRGIQPVLGVRLSMSPRPVPNEVPGAKLAAVAPGSPAANAGLKAGDVIVKVNGHPVSSGEQFLSMTRALAPGDTVTLLLGNGVSSHVVLARRPAPATSK